MSDVTPKDMPGAGPATEPSAPAETPTVPEAETVESKPADTVDWKAKSREWETRAKANFDDAQKWRELLDKTGGKDKNDFDPRAEIEKLHERLESSERARIRAEVSRTTGVDPEDIKGKTEEEMRESAERYNQRFQAKLEEALRSKAAPAAAPAAEVTSNKTIDGPKQLGRADLQNMTRQERIEAHKSGQLDALMRDAN